MNEDVNITIQNSSPYAKLILQIATAMTIVTLASLYIDIPSSIMVIVAILILLSLAVGLFLAIRLFTLGPSKLPLGTFFAGAFFVVGGIIFDGLATIIKSPDLSRESNIIAVSLLGYCDSLLGVLIYGAVVQTLLAILIVTLWAAFLKHRQTITDSAISSNVTSNLDFFKAATGGSDLTWRQYLFPMRLSDLPKAYHFVWFVTIGFVGMIIYRWHLGLEWFGYHVFERVMVVVIALVLSFMGYYFWLSKQYRKSRAA